MSEQRSEQEIYRGIVAAVKKQAAEKPETLSTGDQVSWEIQRRWAAHNKRAFKVPKPPGKGGIGSSAVSPPEVPETKGRKLGLPGDEQADA